MEQQKTLTYQNAVIHYRVTGSGRPVLLLHGFGEDGTVWNQQAEFLKEHFCLIIPDIPGSGNSVFIPSANIETYAEIIKEIALVECGEPAGQLSLIGHSMGGYITLAFAEKYPEYLSSFGLVHSSSFADNNEKKLAREKAIDFINANGTRAFLKTSTPSLFTKSYAEKYPDRIDALINQGEKFSNDALVQYYRAMIARPDRQEVLKSFMKPVLFIIGEFDEAIPLQTSLQQCYIPAHSHVHILKQSAHMGMWEEPEKVNQILLSFLKDQ